MALATPLPVPDPEVARALRLDRLGRLRIWTRRLVWLAVLAAAVAYGGHTWVQWQTPPPVAWDTAAAALQDLEETVVASGRLAPVIVVEIGLEATGRVVAVHAERDQPVAAGQVLAELDTELLEAERAGADARRAVARAARDQAEVACDEAARERDRSALLVERSVVTEQSWEAAQSRVEAAEAALDQARAQVRAADAELDQVEARLARAQVRSPIDGIVLERHLEPGQVVAAQLDTPVLFRIGGDLTRLESTLLVDEADVGRVSAGQPARFTVPAWPGRHFEGVVAAVYHAPHIEANVVSYEVLLAVDNPDGLLRPGMTVTAHIVTARHEHVLTVPLAALRFVPPGEAAGVPAAAPEVSADRVWVLDRGRPVPVAVERGPEGADRVVVEGELAPGDAVIVGTRAGG